MEITDNFLQSELINWFSNAKRALPWRETTDPYKVWLSEIILQQTRVDQGLPYYLRFIETFPTVHQLAGAKIQEVMKLWEGLGYYSRARNLHETACVISQQNDGVFPGTYAHLIKLKGIGPYTAAAIASICFDECVPVVDGNVFRFIGRYHGISDDITKSSTRKKFTEKIQSHMPSTRPGEFNQALMEFGATVCTPAPRCGNCTLQPGCYAFEHKKQHSLPVKSNKVTVREMELDYFIFHHAGHFLLRERKSSNIWKGLFEFYQPGSVSEKDQVQSELKNNQLKVLEGELRVKHVLTHRLLWVNFYHVQVNSRRLLDQIADKFNLKVFSFQDMLSLPRPKVIVNYLQRAVF